MQPCREALEDGLAHRVERRREMESAMTTKEMDPPPCESRIGTPNCSRAKDSEGEYVDNYPGARDSCDVTRASVIRVPEEKA